MTSPKFVLVLLSIATALTAIQATTHPGVGYEPIVSSQNFSGAGVNVTVRMIVEPPLEYSEDDYEPSMALLFLEVTFDPSQISLVELAGGNDGLPLEVNGSTLQGDKLQQNLSTPGLIHWEGLVFGEPGAGGKLVRVSPTLSVVVHASGGPALNLRFEGEDRYTLVLPGESSLPRGVVRSTILSLASTILLPLLSYLLIRYASGRRRAHLIVALISALLIASLAIHALASENSGRADECGPFLMRFDEVTMEDLGNRTLRPVSSGRTYLWLEGREEDHLLVGRLEVGNEVEMETLRMDPRIGLAIQGGEPIPYWIDPSVEELNVSGRQLARDGDGRYFFLGAVRRAAVFSSRGEDVRIKAYYDSVSGILYRMIVSEANATRARVVSLKSEIGREVSIYWPYYVAFLSTFPALTTVLTVLLARRGGAGGRSQR